MQQLNTFHAAARDGDFKTLIYCIVHGALINGPSSDNNKTALHLATEYNNRNIIMILFRNGADPNVLDFYNFTPLMIALKLKNSFIIRLLLQYGATFNINHVDRLISGNFDTFKMEKLKLIKLLMEKDAIDNSYLEPTENILQATQTALCHLAIKDVPHNTTRNVIYDDEASPLLTAVLQNKLKRVKVLIRIGADIECRYRGNETSLIFASDFKYIDIVQVLLEAGADVNAKTRSGRTALISALNSCDTGIVKLLAEKGAKLSITQCMSYLLFIGNILPYEVIEPL